jgi:hypothetical protein
MAMTDDEIRDLFSAYHDRELSPAQHDADTPPPPRVSIIERSRRPQPQ